MEAAPCTPTASAEWWLPEQSSRALGLGRGVTGTAREDVKSVVVKRWWVVGPGWNTSLGGGWRPECLVAAVMVMRSPSRNGGSERFRAGFWI